MFNNLIDGYKNYTICSTTVIFEDFSYFCETRIAIIGKRFHKTKKIYLTDADRVRTRQRLRFMARQHSRVRVQAQNGSMKIER